MTKSLLSPLAWFLLFVAGRALFGLRHGRGVSRARVADASLLAGTLAFWLLATPYVSSALAHAIAISPRSGLEHSHAANVIVLAGGSFVGEDRRVYLGSSTTERVIRGVEEFRGSSARSLVMSGRANGASSPSTEAASMKRLAVQLGVAPEKIQMESDSMTTFEHAPKILQHRLAESSEPIIVVSDPIHLRRATGEFQRVFRSVIPVATHPLTSVPVAAVQSWIPEADSLDESTRVIQEWIGIGWYAIRHRFA